MGDNIGKIMYWTLPDNAASLTTLWHHVNPKHSVVSNFLCILKGQEIQPACSCNMVLDPSPSTHAVNTNHITDRKPLLSSLVWTNIMETCTTWSFMNPRLEE